MGRKSASNGAWEQLQFFRNQLISDKASRRVLERQVEEAKGKPVPDLIASIQKEIDEVGRRIVRWEEEIQRLESQVFVLKER